MCLLVYHLHFTFLSLILSKWSKRFEDAFVLLHNNDSVHQISFNYCTWRLSTYRNNHIIQQFLYSFSSKFYSTSFIKIKSHFRIVLIIHRWLYKTTKYNSRVWIKLIILIYCIRLFVVCDFCIVCPYCFLWIICSIWISIINSFDLLRKRTEIFTQPHRHIILHKLRSTD